MTNKIIVTNKIIKIHASPVPDLMGTGEASGEPSETFEERISRCYELTAFAQLFGEAGDWTLVHGSIFKVGVSRQRIGHAWLENEETGELWEPVRAEVWPREAWYAYAGAKFERRYTLQETREAVMESGHYGRWHESRYP